VIVVLRLDDGDRNIGLVIKDVIGVLGFAAGDELSSDDDASLGKVDLLAYLHHPFPTRSFHCEADELGADIALAEVFLVHKVQSLSVKESCYALPKRGCGSYGQLNIYA
jgi:hypothetical protein